MLSKTTNGVYPDVLIVVVSTKFKVQNETDAALEIIIVMLSTKFV